jgi:hypothetical protein
MVFTIRHSGGNRLGTRGRNASNTNYTSSP